MHSQYKAPFLDKCPIMEILNFYYKGGEFVEKKSQPSFLEKFTSVVKSGAGYNTPEESEKWYTLLRDLVYKADFDENIGSWAELICMAGEAGYITYIHSPLTGSKLDECALALRSHLLCEIDGLYTESESLSEEEKLAGKVKATINQHIARYKQYIDLDNTINLLGVELKLGFTSPRGLEVNTGVIKKSAESSEDNKKIVMRRLCYLGDYDAIKKYYPKKKEADCILELFERFPRVYSKKLPNAVHATLNHQLPLYLQNRYISIFLGLIYNNLDASHDEIISQFKFKSMQKAKGFKTSLSSLSLNKFAPLGSPDSFSLSSGELLEKKEISDKNLMDETMEAKREDASVEATETDDTRNETPLRLEKRDALSSATDTDNSEIESEPKSLLDEEKCKSIENDTVEERMTQDSIKSIASYKGVLNKLRLADDTKPQPTEPVEAVKKKNKKEVSKPSMKVKNTSSPEYVRTFNAS